MIRMKEIESDIMIKPNINQYNSTTFKNIDKIIEYGVETTKKKLPKVQMVLQKWKEK